MCHARLVRRVALALSVAAGLVGCGSYQGPGDHDAGWTTDFVSSRSSQSEIQLRKIEQLVDGRAQRLSLSEPLVSGDKTALVLALPEPLYVYVVNLAPDGTSNIIWPSRAPQSVSGVQRIPTDGGWFTLAGQPGQEVIAVVATRDEQALSGSGRRRVIAAVKRASRRRLTRLQSALPPGLVEAGHATMGVRGEHLALRGDTVSVSSTDPVVMILDVDHRSVSDR